MIFRLLLATVASIALVISVTYSTDLLSMKSDLSWIGFPAIIISVWLYTKGVCWFLKPEIKKLSDFVNHNFKKTKNETN